MHNPGKRLLPPPSTKRALAGVEERLERLEAEEQHAAQRLTEELTRAMQQQEEEMQRLKQSLEEEREGLLLAAQRAGEETREEHARYVSSQIKCLPPVTDI